MNGDLAKRFAAHPRFEWRPGMLAIHTGKSGPPAVRCLDLPRNGEQCFEGWHGGETADVPMEDVRRWFVPDLCDDATAGCLLAMVSHEAPGFRLFNLGPGGAQLECPHMSGGEELQLGFGGLSLGEACAEALLALWGEP